LVIGLLALFSDAFSGGPDNFVVRVAAGNRKLSATEDARIFDQLHMKLGHPKGMKFYSPGLRATRYPGFFVTGFRP
jgi:hypothetical protein